MVSCERGRRGSDRVGQAVELRSGRNEVDFYLDDIASQDAVTLAALPTYGCAEPSASTWRSGHESRRSNLYLSLAIVEILQSYWVVSYPERNATQGQQIVHSNSCDQKRNKPLKQPNDF